MAHEGVSLVLATGGPGMVKASYSVGKPAMGVGSGNAPILVDETADLDEAWYVVLVSQRARCRVVCV